MPKQHEVEKTIKQWSMSGFDMIFLAVPKDKTADVAESIASMRALKGCEMKMIVKKGI